MINLNDKNDALKRILNSKTFSKATTTNVLLKFLVQSTNQQKEISAITIGMELFGRRYDPDKSDVNIRVNISHLRKRLKQYYEQEGANDPIIISIEPGQYQTTFTQKEELQKPKQTRTIIGLTTIILIATTLLILKLKKPNNNVWGPMFENELETTLYLGDVFGYRGPSIFGNIGWHRDSEINSIEEFYEITKNNPEHFETIQPGDYSYVVFENAFNIKPFTHYFTLNNYDYTLRPNSAFKTRAIKDRNSIYAGPLYAQTAFNELFNDFAKNVSLEVKINPFPRKIFMHIDSVGQTKKINLQTRLGEGEYAIASAFNGPNNSRHYMFYSNHGMGLTATIEYFTNTDSVHAFSKRHLKESDEFIALFFVKGKDRTSLSMDLEFIDDNR